MNSRSKWALRHFGSIAVPMVAAAAMLLADQARVDAADPGRATTFSPPSGVCPPFHLRDEDGQIIDPVKGENASRPYSPKKTCGGCHDYDKITQGYHFTQGMGEAPTAEQSARHGWTSSPGNFGGSWCSPAPLYRYLSPKENESAVTMDMTAFTFSRRRAAVAIRGVVGPNTTGMENGTTTG